MCALATWWTGQFVSKSEQGRWASVDDDYHGDGDDANNALAISRAYHDKCNYYYYYQN